jgi:membrane fusion protein (multidrug efflux system)
MVADNNNAKTEAPEAGREQPQSRPGKAPLRGGQWARILIVILLVVALAAWIGQWFYYRQTHVIEDNASVETDLITVSSRLAGRIEQFDIMAGDRLSEGQLLAELYSRPQALELQRRQARVVQTQSRLAFEQRQIAMAEKQLAGGIANAERALDTDLAALQLAEAELEDAQQTWNRSDRLYESGTLSAQQRDRDYYNLLSARARHDQARRQVAQRRTGLNNASLGLLAGAQMTLPTPDLLRARLEVTRQELAVARSELKQQQAELEDMQIRSPADAVVSKTFVEAGEYLSPGQPILMMHQPDKVWVEARVKETKVRRLAVGQPVAIEVDAYPDQTFRGRVQVIGQAATSQFALIPSSNPSGNFTKITQRIPVRIAIKDDNRTRLSPGMMVTIAVDIQAGKDASND